MKFTRLWVVATILGVCIFVGFVLSVPRARDSAEEVQQELGTESPPSVAIRHIFKKGIHTIVGSIDAPNVCTSLSVQATLAAEESDGILLEVFLAEPSGVCLERRVPMNFSTTIAAPEGTPIAVTVNGSPATTTDL